MTRLITSIMLVFGMGAGTLAAGVLEDRVLNPSSHLTEARLFFEQGQEAKGLEHLAVVLENAPVGSPEWIDGHDLAFEKKPGLFVRSLMGTRFPVPLASAPSSEVTSDLAGVFRIPAVGHFTGTLSTDSKKTLYFLLQSGRVGEAVSLVDRHLEKRTHDLEALMLQAALHEHAGENDKALLSYHQAAAQSSGSVVIPFSSVFGVFRVNLRKGDRRAAEKALSEYFARAKAHLGEKLENHKYAANGGRSLFSTILESRRHLVEALNAMSLVQLSAKQHKEALYLAEQALLLVPGSPQLVLNRAAAFDRLGQAESARAELLKLSAALSGLEIKVLEGLDQRIEEGVVDLKGPLTHREVLRTLLGEVRIQQALVEYHQGDRNTAIAKLREAVNLEPKNAEAFYHLGDLLGRDPELLEEGLVNLRKAAILVSEDAALHRAAQARIDELLEEQAKRVIKSRSRHDQLAEHFDATVDVDRMHQLRRDIKDGLAFLRVGKYERARDHFRKLETKSKDVVEIYRYLGFASQKLRRYRDALEAYDKALKIDASDAHSLSQKAVTIMEYGLDGPSLVEALPLAEKAHSLQSEDPIIKANLGWIIARMGEVSRGVNLIKEALKLDPNDADIHYRLGSAYYQIRLFGFALSKFDDALGLRPDHLKAKVYKALSQAQLGKTREALDGLSAAQQEVGTDKELGDRIKKLMEIIQGGVGAIASAPSLADPFIPLDAKQIAARDRTQDILQDSIDLVRTGRLREAITLLEARRAEDENSQDLHFDLGVLHVTAGDIDKAEPLFQKMIENNTQELRAYHALAHLEFLRGDVIKFHDLLGRTRGLVEQLRFSEMLNGVAEKWEHVLDTDPDDEPTIYQLAMIRLHQNQLVKARDVLAKSASQRCKLLMGEVLLRLHFTDRSEMSFHQGRALLGEAGYSGAGELDQFWKLVNDPVTPAQEVIAVREPKFRPSREFEDDPVLSDIIKGLARNRDIDKTNVTDTGVFNRRWDQIDETRRRRFQQLRTREQREEQARAEELSEDGGGATDSPPSEDGPDESGPTPPDDLEGEPALDLEIPEPAGAPVVDSGKADKEGALEILARRQLDRGIELAQAGRFPEAVSSLRGALSFAPKLTEAYATLVTIEMLQERWETARQFFDLARQKLKDLGPLAHLQAHLEFRTGGISRSVDLWEKYPDPASSGSPLEFAKKAEAPWRERLTDHPKDAEASVQLATLQFLQGRVEEALQTLQPVRTDQRAAVLTAEVLVFLGAAAGDPGRIAEAAQVLTQAGTEKALKFLKPVLSLEGRIIRKSPPAAKAKPGAKPADSKKPQEDEEEEFDPYDMVEGS